MNDTKRTRKNRFSIILCLIVFFAGATPLFADPSMTIPGGLTQDAVQRIKGAPLSTDVQETSRVIVWIYKDGPVYFRDGRTVGLHASHSKRMNRNDLSSKKRFASAQKQKLSQADVDDIISAIPNDKAPTTDPSSALPNISDPTTMNGTSSN